MSMDPARLTAIPLFSQLSEPEAKRLAAFASETSIAEGQILMKQGDYSTELIAIEEGTAEVSRDGKKIAEVGEGDLIGEMGLLSREPRNADVIATSPMLVIKLTHWEIRRMSEATVEADRGDRQGAPAGGRGRPGVLQRGLGADGDTRGGRTGDRPGCSLQLKPRRPHKLAVCSVQFRCAPNRTNSSQAKPGRPSRARRLCAFAYAHRGAARSLGRASFAR